MSFSKRRTITSFIAQFLIIVIFSQVAFAHKPATHIWDERRQIASLPFPVPATSGSALLSTHEQRLPSRLASRLTDPRLSSPLLASLPSDLFAHVTLRSTGAGQKGPLVVLIEDLHQNAEAQANISSAIRSFEKTNGQVTVGLEGAYGPFVYGALTKLQRPDVIRMAADQFLSEGDISGPAHAGYTAAPGTNLHFIGVDDPAAYSLNVQAYRGSHAVVKESKAGVASRRAELARLKPSVFNPDLLAFDRLVESHRAGETSFGDYLRRVAMQSDTISFSVETFLQAYQMEQSMDFHRVEREREDALLELGRVADDSRLKELIAVGLAYRENQISFASYYRHLKETCASAGVHFSKYPALDNYVRYVLLTDAVDGARLYQDVAALEREVYSRLALSAEEKNLVADARQAYLAGLLVDFALTSDQWADYAANRDRNPSRIDLSRFETFYTAADARNGAMLRNLMSEASGRKQKFAVLVAGGFHSAGLTDLFRREKIGFVTVTPKVTKIEENELHYLSIFDRERTPLERMFVGQPLFLGAPVSGARTSILSDQDPTTGVVTKMAVLVLAAGTALGSVNATLRDAGQRLFTARPASGNQVEVGMEGQDGIVVAVSEEGREADVPAGARELDRSTIGGRQIVFFALVAVGLGALLWQALQSIEPGAYLAVAPFAGFIRKPKKGTPLERAEVINERGYDKLLEGMSGGLRDQVFGFLPYGTDLRKVADDMKAQTQGALERQHTSIDALETFTELPTGEESGLFITVDWGGTNGRIRLWRLNKDGKAYELVVEREKFQFDVRMQNNPNLALEKIASEISELKREFEQAEGATDDHYKLGFTFAFPAQAQSINYAELSSWVKGWGESDEGRKWVGRDIVGLMRKALVEQGVSQVDVAALANDTVDPLMAANFERQNALLKGSFFYRLWIAVLRILGLWDPTLVRIGMVLGTGYNMAAYFGPAYGIRNLEAGNFDGVMFLQGDSDRRVDNESREMKGRHYLEKMVAGKYLADVFRHEVLRLAAAGDPRFQGLDEIDLFQAPQEGTTPLLTSALVGTFAGKRTGTYSYETTEGFNALTSAIRRSGLTPMLGNEDIDQRVSALAALANVLIDRSAMLLAAQAVGVIEILDPTLRHRHAIRVEGSLFDELPEYAVRVNNGLEMILGPEKARRITFESNKGKTSLGGAVTAATASKAPQGNFRRLVRFITASAVVMLSMAIWPESGFSQETTAYQAFSEVFVEQISAIEFMYSVMLGLGFLAMTVSLLIAASVVLYLYRGAPQIEADVDHFAAQLQKNNYHEYSLVWVINQMSRLERFIASNSDSRRFRLMRSNYLSLLATAINNTNPDVREEILIRLQESDLILSNNLYVRLSSRRLLTMLGVYDELRNEVNLVDLPLPSKTLMASDQPQTLVAALAPAALLASKFEDEPLLGAVKGKEKPIVNLIKDRIDLIGMLIFHYAYRRAGATARATASEGAGRDNVEAIEAGDLINPPSIIRRTFLNSIFYFSAAVVAFASFVGANVVPVTRFWMTYIAADVVEGTNMAAKNSAGPTDTDTFSGATTSIVSGPALAEIGIMPDVYGDLIATSVLAEHRSRFGNIDPMVDDEPQMLSESMYETEDQVLGRMVEKIRATLEQIAEANDIAVSDIEVVWLNRGDKAKTEDGHRDRLRGLAFERIQAENGITLTLIGDGTLDLSVAAGISRRNGKHLVYWGTTGSPEGMSTIVTLAPFHEPFESASVSNDKSQSVQRAAVAGLRIYSKNINYDKPFEAASQIPDKAPKDATVMGSNRFAWMAEEVADIRRNPHSAGILSGRKVFRLGDISEGASFRGVITRSGIFNQPAVRRIKNAPNGSERYATRVVRTGQEVSGAPRWWVEEIVVRKPLAKLKDQKDWFIKYRPNSKTTKAILKLGAVILLAILINQMDLLDFFGSSEGGQALAAIGIIGTTGPAVPEGKRALQAILSDDSDLSVFTDQAILTRAQNIKARFKALDDYLINEMTIRRFILNYLQNSSIPKSGLESSFRTQLDRLKTIQFKSAIEVLSHLEFMVSHLERNYKSPPPADGNRGVVARSSALLLIPLLLLEGGSLESLVGPGLIYSAVVLAGIVFPVVSSLFLVKKIRALWQQRTMNQSHDKKARRIHADMMREQADNEALVDQLLQTGAPVMPVITGVTAHDLRVIGLNGLRVSRGQPTRALQVTHLFNLSVYIKGVRDGLLRSVNGILDAIPVSAVDTKKKQKRLQVYVYHVNQDPETFGDQELDELEQLLNRAETEVDRGNRVSVVVALHGDIAGTNNSRLARLGERHLNTLVFRDVRDDMRDPSTQVYSYNALLQGMQDDVVVDLLKGDYDTAKFVTFSKIPAQFQADGRLARLWTALMNLGKGWMKIDDAMKNAWKGMQHA